MSVTITPGEAALLAELTDPEARASFLRCIAHREDIGERTCPDCGRQVDDYDLTFI